MIFGHFWPKKKFFLKKSKKKIFWSILKGPSGGVRNRLWTNIGGNKTLDGPLRLPKPVFNHFKNFWFYSKNTTFFKNSFWKFSKRPKNGKKKIFCRIFGEPSEIVLDYILALRTPLGTLKGSQNHFKPFLFFFDFWQKQWFFFENFWKCVISKKKIFLKKNI